MQIEQILRETRTIAVVGLSDNPRKASFGVAKYLMAHYEVIPVNPNHSEVLGLKCYPDLRAVPGPVDMVDLFQRSESVLPFVQPSIDIGVKCFWMQLNIRHAQARLQLEAAGISVIDDKCTQVEHLRYLR